jgi:hypothetical protein
MWVFAGLLLIAFAFLFFGKISKNRWMSVVLGCLGCIVWFIAVSLQGKDVYMFNVGLGFMILFNPVFDLIAMPILRRRLVAPCIPVKKYRATIYNIIILFLLFAAIIFAIIVTLRDFMFLPIFGPAVVSYIIWGVFIVLGKIEICRNGVWKDERLYSWEDYKYFSWALNPHDNFELRLVSKWGSTMRLVVPLEAREAVSQLLEANLPDATGIEMESQRTTCR